MAKIHLLTERLRAVSSYSSEGSSRQVLDAGQMCRGIALSGDTRDEEPFYGQPGKQRACGHRDEDWGPSGYGQVQWLRRCRVMAGVMALLGVESSGGRADQITWWVAVARCLTKLYGWTRWHGGTVAPWH